MASIWCTANTLVVNLTLWMSTIVHIWLWVKTLVPVCSHQNSWDLWMFIPSIMVLYKV